MKTLSSPELGDYDKVKAAILDHYEVMPETQWQWFRALCFKIGDRPKALIPDLRECATRWLNPTTQGERDIVDKVVLEYICYAMPLAVRMWLLRVGPTTLDQAAACLDNYFLAERVGTKMEWATPEKGTMRTRSGSQGNANPIPLRRLSIPSFRPSSMWIPPPTWSRWAGVPPRPLEDGQVEGERNPPGALLHLGPCYSCGQMGHLH